MQHTMRRQDRAMEDKAAWSLLAGAEYGVLSTVDENRQPYGVPLNYVLVGDALFIHSAQVGHKLENIAANPKVSFCVVGDTEPLADKFSTRYQSVIAFGSASRVEGEAKRPALVALLEKYFPEHMERGHDYVDKLLDKTAVIKVQVLNA